MDRQRSGRSSRLQFQAQWDAREKAWKESTESWDAREESWKTREESWKAQWDAQFRSFVQWFVFFSRDDTIVGSVQGALAMYHACALMAMSAIAPLLGPLIWTWSPLPGVVFGLYDVTGMVRNRG